MLIAVVPRRRANADCIVDEANFWSPKALIQQRIEKLNNERLRILRKIVGVSLL